MARFKLLTALLSAAGIATAVPIDLDTLYSDSSSNGQLFSKVYNETIEWGTYKPNLFFGVKDRSPSPLTLGLAWAVPLGNEQMDVRHTYRYQSGDGVTAYYEYHDGQGNCREIINDPAANARFEIDLVKQVSLAEGSSDPS